MNTVVFQGVVMLSRTISMTHVDCLNSRNRYECLSEVSWLYTVVRKVALDAKTSQGVYLAHVS